MSAISHSITTIYDTLLTVCFALLSKFVINKIWLIRNIMMALGKYSMNMFLTHTFIKAYYFADITYGWKHSMLILAVLLIDTFIISFIIEWIKEKIRYNKLIHLLCQKSNKLLMKD